MEDGSYYMALFILGNDKEAMMAGVVLEGVKGVRLDGRECGVYLSQ